MMYLRDSDVNLSKSLVLIECRVENSLYLCLSTFHEFRGENAVNLIFK